jgi:hypothetical protein
MCEVFSLSLYSPKGSLKETCVKGITPGKFLNVTLQ